MKKLKSIIFIAMPLALGMFFFFSCEPQIDDAIELSAPPTNISFTIEEKVDENNTYILTNTTTGAFLYQWDLGNGTVLSGDVVEAYYPLMGDYEVTLRAFNDGGFGEGKQTISVPEDDSAPCISGSLMEFMTDCDERVWKLLPDAGAYWVGPDDATTWWSNAADDVTTRFCAFDDEWIFRVDGEMEYDSKGDLWAEDYMGFNFECITDAQLAPNQASWGSGLHNFSAVEGSVDQIILIGEGAYMGLPKVANGQEVTEPVSTITYDVIDRSQDASGKYIELEVNFGGGLWRFKYVSTN